MEGLIMQICDHDNDVGGLDCTVAGTFLVTHWFLVSDAVAGLLLSYFGAFGYILSSFQSSLSSANDRMDFHQL